MKSIRKKNTHFEFFSSINNSALQQVNQLASSVFTNIEELHDLLQSGNVVYSDPLAVLISPFAEPGYIDDELDSSDEVEILYNLLNEKLKVNETRVQPVYSTDIPVPNCLGSAKRINKDAAPGCTNDSYR